MAEQLPELLPIVIPPRWVTLGNRKFSYAGRGLLRDGHSYDAEARNNLPPLTPPSSDDVDWPARPPQTPKRLLAYWKAQCVFRGLNPSGTLAELQSVIRTSNAGMTAELAAAERRLDNEFRTKNALERDRKWETLENDNEKAELDPCRYLREAFPLRGKWNKCQIDSAHVVVLEIFKRLELHRVAASLGLPHEYVTAPLKADGSPRTIDKWTVVGTNTVAVQQKVQEIGREAVRMKRQVLEARQELIRKKHQAIVERWKQMNGANGYNNDDDNDDDEEKWDVAGSWTISCPSIEQDLDQGRPRQCRLSIGFTQRGRRRQMWARFNFIILSGVFRFANPMPDNAGRLFAAPRPPDMFLPDPYDYLDLEDIEDQERAMNPTRSNEVETSSETLRDDRDSDEGSNTGADDEDGSGDNTEQASVETSSDENDSSETNNDGYDSDDEGSDQRINGERDSDETEVEGGDSMDIDPRAETNSQQTESETDVDIADLQDEHKYDDYDDVVFDSPEMENEYFFGAFAQPSPKDPQWFYRWRGENMATGTKEQGSDLNVCAIDFYGPGGTQLHGAFFSKLIGRVTFDGWKTGPLKSRLDIDHEWNVRA
ncbi:MAG: hypothetical protein M1837_007138 [Sclerophora amabilis]|nr:MAG: hypothetical protein M1837_007138 [Sclerophora amabilis]